MLSELEIYAVLPAKDLRTAREFYKEKLGLEPTDEREDGVVFQTSAGAKIFMYETDNAGTAKNTALSWSTDDLDAEMADLRSRGVVFEEYDFSRPQDRERHCDLRRRSWRVVHRQRGQHSCRERGHVNPLFIRQTPGPETP